MASGVVGFLQLVGVRLQDWGGSADDDDGRWESLLLLGGDAGGGGPPRMTTRRQGCAAVPLGDDAFMVLGGHDGVCETRGVEIWRIHQQPSTSSATSASEEGGGRREVWTASPGRDMGTPRLGCVAVALQSGGSDTGSDDAFGSGRRGGDEDDAVTGQRQGRRRPATIDCVIVVGGHNGRTVATAERYHPRLEMWTESTPPPPFGGVFDAAAVGIGDRLYLLGGHDGKTPLSDVRVFHSGFCTWEAAPPMTSRRFQFGAALLGRHIYVVGGNDGVDAMRSVERYDPTARTWTTTGDLPPMNVKRKGCVAAAGPDGRLYVFGGHDGRAVLSSCERYDPRTRTWTMLPPMQKRRFGSAVAVVGNRIVVVGGFDGTSALDSVEQYTCAKPKAANVASSSSPPPEADHRPVTVDHPDDSSRPHRRVHPLDGDEAGAPEELLCPITSDVMVDPVVAADGYSYERQAIEEWFRRGGGGGQPRSPTTNVVLSDTRLLPNHNLRSLCRRWNGG
jgi:hypothetical protein